MGLLVLGVVSVIWMGRIKRIFEDYKGVRDDELWERVSSYHPCGLQFLMNSKTTPSVLFWKTGLCVS